MVGCLANQEQRHLPPRTTSFGEYVVAVVPFVIPNAFKQLIANWSGIESTDVGEPGARGRRGAGNSRANRYRMSTRRQGYSQKAEHHGKDSKPSGPRPSPGKYLFWHYALPFFCLLTCMSIRNDI